jgi:predicted ATPase/DNA-binding XRE family transcriptional regulator
MDTAERSLGELLKRHRARRGLTQEELAEVAGISTRTISDVERGIRTSMYRDTLDRLARALELGDEERGALLRVGRPHRAPRIALAGHPASIPIPPSPIIGREREVNAVAAQIRTGEAKLAVISGPGGIGKTRLAIEIARTLESELRDGAVFIDLAGTSDPELLPAVIADACAIAQLREPLVDRIVDYLREKESLLVLDTFERLVEGAPLLAEIVGSCAGVRILVTSRIPLRLRGEREFPLRPLAVSGSFDPAGSETEPPALSLFGDRALSVRPDLRLDAGPAREEIVAICRRLDGIPLAIELAAARVRHLPLRSLREALDVPLDVLADGPRDAPDRQRSMRDAVAWSYDLLARADQSLLRRLSIFSGGWAARSAELVAGDDARAGSNRLVDHNLVSMTESADGTPRFRMFDVIREFAAERRDAEDETASLSRRHAEHLIDVAEAEEPRLRAAEQAAAARRLASENDNLRQALRWSLSQGESTLALRLAGALWPFWRLRGDLIEGRAWLEEALALPHPADETRAKALWGAAWLALHQGDFDRSEALGAELRDAAEEAGDALARRNGLTVLAKVATARGEHAEAVRLCEAALDACRALDPSWELATSVFNLGTAVLHTGDLTGAETLFIEAAERYRVLGDDIFAARATGYLGYPALLRGDVVAARRHMLDALDRFIEIDNAWGIAEALERISGLEAATGDAERAAEIAGAGARVRETVLIDPMQEEQAIIAPYLRQARASLGEDTWLDTFDRGRQLTPESARALLAVPS